MIYINNRGKDQATCFNKLKDTDEMYVTIKTDEDDHLLASYPYTVLTWSNGKHSTNDPMSLASLSKSKSMHHPCTGSGHLPAPQIRNVSYWNPHVYSLGLPRQSWNKNASSVLHIAICSPTFCKKIRRYHSQPGKGCRAAGWPRLTAGEPARHGPGPGPQRPLQSPALPEPSVESKTPESPLEVSAVIELNI